MNKPCLFLFFCCPLFCVSLSAQGYCSGDTVYFTEPAHPVEYDDVVYKTAPQIDEWTFEVPENIPLRVYYPTDLPPGEKRPLIALIHGGYFIWGSYLDFDAFARALAQKGFITATIEYRLCHRSDCEIARLTANPCNISWGNSFVPSAYIAAVDVNDGIRWLQQHATDYHIDPEKVVVAGHSAGAFTALNAAFLDQSEIQQMIPSAGVSGKYLGEPLDPVTGIRACITMSGASFDLDWIGSSEVVDEHIAVGIVHGTNDGVVGYGENKAVPCCQTYGAIVHGGCDVAKRVKALGGNYFLLSGEGFGHDIGESPWFDTLAVQIPAFVVKTVVCGENMAKHSAVQRATPLNMCPGNLPLLPAALPCDVDAVTAGITTPVKEAPGGRMNETLGLLVYPNPARDLLHISALSPESSGEWQVVINNMQGLEIDRFTLELNNNSAIRIDQFPAGIYSMFFRSATDKRSGNILIYKSE